MIEFQYLHVKGRPQFKDQFFDFTQNGINLVLGHNQRTGSNNGVGKSLFFGELADFLSEDVVSGTKQDRVRRGSVKFGVKRNDVLFECEREFSPKEKITVWRNGKDLAIRELSAAREYIRTNVVPYGEQEVVSYLYLDLANGAHPLVTGTTAVRKQFFRTFFKHIEGLSSLKKIVDSELSAKSEGARRYEDLKSTILSLKEAIPPDLDETRTELETCQAEFLELQEKASRISRAVVLKESMDSLSVDVPEELRLSEEELDSRIKARQSEHRVAKKILGRWAELDDWSVTNKETRRQMRSIDLPEGLEVTTLNERISSLESKLESITTQQSDRKAERSNLSRALSRQQRELEETTVLISRLKEEKDTCPTCGQPFNNEHAEKELHLAHARKKQISKEVAAAEARIEELDAEPDPTQRIESLRGKIDECRQNLDSLKKYERLERSLTEKPVEPDIGRETAEKQTESALADIDSMEKARSFARVRSEWLSLPRDLRKSALHSKSSLDRIVSLNERASELRLVVSEAELRSRELAEKVQERKKLRKSLEDVEELKVLQAALSRKGVEKELISSACSLLSDQVNRYAKHVFVEDFEFSFDLESNFEITVKRKLGKRVEESDVRKLSGAEKRLFSMVLLIALLSFVPPEERSNLLILDEPTATMGEDNKANFVRFLPVLNKVIPNIVVITPLEPKDYVAISPNVFTVVKNGSTSYIEKGVINGSTARDTVPKPVLAKRSTRIK
jgi:DNA repair exonuclease SbcCD ATPase subunit